MIEELEKLLDLLGDVTSIAGWVLGGFILFKLIILLSTTGSIVYLSKMGMSLLKEHLDLRSNNLIEKEKESKKATVTDVEIKGLCITSDGTYERVVESLKLVVSHLTEINDYEYTYIHANGATWLRQAIEEKIKRDKET